MREGAIFSRRLRRDILFLIAVKLALLYLLYRLFFAGHDAALGGFAVAHHLLGS